MHSETTGNAKRLALIRIPLSEEQIAFIKERTGSEVSEAIVAGMVEAADPLQNELVGEEADALAAEIWEKNQQFVSNMEKAPQTLAAFQARIGHVLERSVPNFAYFR